MTALNKKWKEFLYGFSGFGPNFLMVLMGAYFTDAINPAALGDGSYQAIASGVCYILPAVFPVLYMLGKIFDGIIDIPFAHITDTLSTKWGRRRPAIAVAMIPMILSYAMCWWPIGGADNQLINTIWIYFWSIIFFGSYTMCLIAYYGSLSTTCKDEAQRLRVSSYKSFFDTISYCFVYALVPIILEAAKLHINKFVYLALPLMLTITIPLFMIKEGEKYGYPENNGLSPEKIRLFESIKLTFGNRTFKSWLVVNGCTFFGLQMFLVGMNAMIIGGMGFNGGEMALVNTCAFAPVPVMLYLFNKMKAKKGVRFTYQTCLLAFAVAIMSFFFASKFMLGTDNKMLQYIIGCSGAVMGSWAIGAFFMMPYLVPAQISSVEEKLTGKNHSAMYFAADAIVSSIVGAVSSSLVYENIKMLFIDKSSGKVVWAESFTEAAEKIGCAELTVFNLGTLLVPFVVCIACVAGFFLAFRMPKDYSPELVALELKKHNPDLDIASIVSASTKQEEKGEIIFVQIGLSILSGFIFGFVWAGFIYRSLKELLKKKVLLPWVLSCFVPFLGVYLTLKADKELTAYAKENGVEMGRAKLAHIISGILLPILPVNLVSLTIMQNKLNYIYKKSSVKILEAE